ncbi:MAG: hypothetical protein UHU21_17120, partial [Lachnospiraceae bacterium]|nr:hypothetical protein [Lachnospiraceae bacterium]
MPSFVFGSHLQYLYKEKVPQNLIDKVLRDFSELATRIELVTSALPMRRTTDCAMPEYCLLLFSATNLYYHSFQFSVNQNFK